MGVGQVWEGSGNHLLYPNPHPGLLALHRASQICASYIAGANPSSPIGQAGVLLEVRGNTYIPLSQGLPNFNLWAYSGNHPVLPPSELLLLFCLG